MAFKKVVVRKKRGVRKKIKKRKFECVIRRIKKETKEEEEG